MKKEITKELIENEVKRLDPKLSVREPAFRVACVLLTSLKTGANEIKIANFLGIKKSEIMPIAKNLRASKVWEKDKINADWFDKKTGSISFWCDVSVGLGYLKRA